MNNSNIIAKDANGYKYKLNYTNLLYNKNPSMLMKNPFAIDNLKMFLSNNYPYYELVDNEYKSCKTKMRFICHHHADKGIQYNTPDNIVNNHHACRYCGYELMGKDRQIDESKIVKRCDELSLKYIERKSKNGESYIYFICPKHKNCGIQNMSWTHFKDCTNGCIHCVSSMGEKKVRETLAELQVKFIEQKTFSDCVYIKELKFDFYLPDYNIAIEYDGQQHFRPVDFSGKGIEYAQNAFLLTKQRDKVKDDYCTKNNIKLIRIPYTEFDNIPIIINNELMINNTNT